MLLSVGLVGCGYWGEKLARNVQENRRMRLTWAYDADRERAGQLALRYGAAVPADLGRALAQPGTDLVVVATPPAAHGPVVRAALEYGAHVVVTKPLTTTSNEAQELADLAAQKGLVLAVDHTFLYTGAAEAIRRQVLDGALGRLQWMHFTRVNLGKFQQDVSVIWDLAPHDIALAMYWLGDDELTTVGASVHATDPRLRPSLGQFRLHTRGGCVITSIESWLSPIKVRQAMLVGDQGMALWEDTNPVERVKLYDSRVILGEAGATGGVEPVGYRAGGVVSPMIDEREALAKEFDAIAAAILDGRPLVSDGAMGVQVLRVLEALDESVRRGGADVAVAGAGAPAAAAGA